MNRVLTFWSWNGCIDERTIRRDIDFFREVGIGGFFMHARAGLQIPYMSDEWLRLVRYAAEYGAQNGLDAYLYDENGWPSGFANGEVPKLGRDYWQAYMLPLPVTFQKAKESGEEVLASFTHNGAPVTFVVRRNRYYADLLHPAATDAFIAATHERYYAAVGDLFGTAIKGIFTDEPQMSTRGFPYTADLFDAFIKEYGYDLKEKLPLLCDDSVDGDKVRFAYRSLIAKRYEQNYAGKIGEWCRAHNLLLTGHMAAEDGLYCQIPSQASVMPCYRHFGLPGIDHLGLRTASPVLLRQAASAAEQDGKGLLSETFGGSGHGARLRELLDTWCYQTTLGVNVACLHLSAVSALGRRKRDYPPTFSYHRNDAQCLSAFTARIDTLAQYAAQPRVTEIAVLHPISTFFARYASENVTEELSGITLRYRQLLETLARLQYDCDLCDEMLLREGGRAESGRLHVGNKSYGVLILPECRTLCRSSVQTIEAFIAQGGKVLFCGKVPDSVEGEPTNIFAEWRDAGKIRPVGLRDNLVRNALQNLHIDPPFPIYAQDGRGLADNVCVTVRGQKGKRVVFVYNTATAEREVSFGADELYSVRLPAKQSIVIDEQHRRIYNPYAHRYTPFSRSVADGNIRTLACPAPVRLDANALVLDKAVVRVGKQVFKGEVISLNDKVYAAIHTPTAVTVTYAFESRDFSGDIRIAVEHSPDLQSVELNGVVLAPDGGYDYDEDMRTYTGHVTSGKGEIVLKYLLSPVAAPQQGAFETATNVYFYPTELENVTLLGDFDVEWEYSSQANARGRYLVGHGFALTQKGQTAYAHNAPFYRGRYALRQTFPDCDSDFCVTFDGDFSVAEVTVNGKRLISIDNTFTLPAHTAEAEFVFYTTDRNRMGPHHYFGLDTEIEGPETFMGQKDWLDRFNVKVAYDRIPADTRIRDTVIKDERVTKCTVRT